MIISGFPSGSDGKESACNAADMGSIPGLGRSPGEGHGYPLQYSWASLVAQLVKNPPAMQETRVRSLGWEGPLEKGMATLSSILAWRIPWAEKPDGPQSLGLKDPLEEGMAIHSSILAWRIPWTEEPWVLQSMRSQRVGHD